MTSKRTKQFMGFCNYLRNPLRIDRIKLMDFLLDLKATGKVDTLITLSEEDIITMNRNELIIEFDNVRSRVHSRADLLFTLFPDLSTKWLDQLTY